ncbi:MAG TPA: plasmid pRiA4b ORF-3 family protein [Chloroflexi bacterium]|nr:plasmid pRiA4b ORF-3 family protein [Chloroflexota bacterium]
MARRKQSRGKCAFCGREMTKGGLSKHLSSCSQRQETIDAANAKRGAAKQLYHLQVQDAWSPDFWLHLEMNGDATLQDLDYYLRAIWLECCGHLSRFSFGGWGGGEIAKETRIDRIFEPGVELTHIYDFGTSSETLIKAVRAREGKPLTAHPIMLMARNNTPEVVCVECGKPAAYLCMECLYEYDEPGWLCAEHAETHPHDNYGDPVPLVNSPRLGMCGYDGPAEPPY